MLISELIAEVMNVFPELDEPEEILRGLNRVIGQINGVITGITDKVMAVEDGVAVSGYVWLQKGLTLKANIKEVKEVWVNGVKYNNVPLTTLTRNDSDNTYSVVAFNKIQFGGGNTTLEDEPNIELLVLRCFDKVDPSFGGVSAAPGPELDLPDYWQEGIISGVIAHLALNKMSDESLYKHNYRDYREMLGSINRWEGSKFPEESVRPYNYHDPSDYFKNTEEE